MTEHDEKMMQQMNKEKEKLILLSITRYGYLAMPQDYKFLRRHSLLNIYLEIVNRSMSGGDIRLLEKTAKMMRRCMRHPSRVTSLAWKNIGYPPGTSKPNSSLMVTITIGELS